MYTLNEALARERTRDARSLSRRVRVANELAAQRRWHRVTRYARSLERRHAQRANELAAQ